MAEAEEVEVSRTQMLEKFLTDDALHDITLVGKDEKQVPAIRSVLSSRSKVFRQMLLGNFKESTQATVKITGYTGAVLQAMFEYICTDTARIFSSIERIGKEPSQDPRSSTAQQSMEEDFETLIEVASAASYFQLPGLIKKVQNAVSEVGEGRPISSLSLLGACHKVGIVSVPTPVCQIIMSNVRGKPGKVRVGCPPQGDGKRNVDTTIANEDLPSTTAYVVDHDHIIGLNSEALEAVLKDDYMEWEEYQLYQLVSIWVNHGINDIDDKDKDDDYSSRVQIARSRLMQHIHLENVDARLLAQDVSKSGFVDKEQLYAAYRQQAIAATAFQDYYLKVNRPRYQEWNEIAPQDRTVVAIKVDGTGNSEVNGIYKRDGEFGGHAKFIKPSRTMASAKEEGKFREYEISQYVSANKRYWTIALVYEEQPGTNQYIDDCYGVEVSETNDVPPRDGWKKEPGATPRMSASPKLLYKLERSN